MYFVQAVATIALILVIALALLAVGDILFGRISGRGSYRQRRLRANAGETRGSRAHRANRSTNRNRHS